MKHALFGGLSEADRQSLRESFSNAGLFRSQLMKLLDSIDNTLSGKGLSEEDYNNSAWQDKQAFNNGRLSMLRQIKTYLEKEEE